VVHLRLEHPPFYSGVLDGDSVAVSNPRQKAVSLSGAARLVRRLRLTVEQKIPARLAFARLAVRTLVATAPLHLASDFDPSPHRVASFPVTADWCKIPHAHPRT
jgi:hypothetical protein